MSLVAATVESAQTVESASSAHQDTTSVVEAALPVPQKPALAKPYCPIQQSQIVIHGHKGLKQRPYFSQPCF